MLGGGGVTGVAWEIGLLAGLARAGVHLSDADLVIGTSAGSVVATHVASGVDLQRSLAAQIEGHGREIPARLPLGMILRYAWAALWSRSPEAFARRIGRLALAAATVPEAERKAVVTSRLPVQDWPRKALQITTVDTATGVPRIWTESDGVSLGDAVASSCAVPGVWPPVTIQGHRYMDGGMRSAANAHLAEGFERIVIIAPITTGFGLMPAVSAQAADLRRAGSHVVVLSPDAAARKAIGRNVLDPSRRTASARAGDAQALKAVEAVRAVWNGEG